MNVLKKIQKSIIKNKNRNAFYIDGKFYTYSEFINTISSIRKSIQGTTSIENKNIGLVTNDDIETYASIIALWFEGKAYVPLNPEHPIGRNIDVINRANVKTIIDSSENSTFQEYTIINSKKLQEVEMNIIPKKAMDIELAYIFFTSGTTGVPKGVTITYANLKGFINAFDELGFIIDNKDRFLQMFDLTFDLSVMSYLIPLIKGACIYTIPKGKIKYNYIFELLDTQSLTFALMVPSIIQYLRPYFDEIDVPSMKYSLFCGEALPLDVTEEWAKCLPNAEILNVYGPTENTIFCTSYKYRRDGKNKSNNGVLCIGKPMLGVDTIIVNTKNQILSFDEKGELCLAGELLSPGYWKNKGKNKESFFNIVYRNKLTRFYKTGDLCIEDEEGDIMYLGRIDFQAQIQGFRVELSEVEFHVKTYLMNVNAVAVAFTNKMNNMEIGLVIEDIDFDTENLLNYCRTKMPSYMIPTRINFIKSFPLNVNGKIDRIKLAENFL